VGYLHTAVKDLNSGLPRTNPDSSRVEYLNQGPPDFKSKPLGHAIFLNMSGVPEKFHADSFSAFVYPMDLSREN